MRAVIVCVDFADILALTLPWNRHHFDNVLVITSPEDTSTQQVAEFNQATTFLTDSFFQDGADFAKWKALEEGLDFFGRHGWLCLMDADIAWPKQIDWSLLHFDDCSALGYLFTPLRRMMTETQGLTTIPPESEWSKLPLHPQQQEWAGYTQIFHASDPVLGPPPWHQVDWKHAGGADSFFQAKWPTERKVRPPFEVLHIGQSGVNWCGRTTQRLDGTTPPEARQRRDTLQRYIRGRMGKHGDERFRHERL